MHVVAGGIELNTFEQEEQTRNVQKIIGHPNYDSHTISNDICLLHLQVDISIDVYISNYICPGVPHLQRLGAASASARPGDGDRARDELHRDRLGHHQRQYLQYLA